MIVALVTTELLAPGYMSYIWIMVHSFLYV